MMFAFKPGVRITGVEGFCVEGETAAIHLRFNTGHIYTAPKIILDTVYMLNSNFPVEHMTVGGTEQTNIDSQKVLNDFFAMGILDECSFDTDNEYVQAICNMKDYIVHFPKISNVGIMAAVLLKYIGTKAVFHENRTITNLDETQNIYFNFCDIGKNIIFSYKMK